MATIFLDTSAINFLVKKKEINGSDFKKLISPGDVLVIGRNTLYECANYKDPSLCKKIHTFIEKIDPEYTLTRNHLYQNEAEKLKYDTDFGYWCSHEEKDLIKKYNKVLIEGNFDTEFKKNIDERKKNFEEARLHFKPFYKLKLLHYRENKLVTNDLQPNIFYLFIKNDIIHIISTKVTFPLQRDKILSYDKILQEIKKGKLSIQAEQELVKLLSNLGYQVVSLQTLSKLRKLASTFDQRISNIPINEKTIDILTKTFTSVGVSFSKNETIKFLHNQAHYPALRTLYRSNVWLTDSVNINSNVPSKDRIPDAIQFTEASYCTDFVSEDSELIDPGDFGSKLNPDIGLLHINDFLKELISRKTSS